MSKSGVGPTSGILLYGPGGLRISALQSKLIPLTQGQIEMVNKAKKYATELSISSMMTRRLVPTTPSANAAAAAVTSPQKSQQQSRPNPKYHALQLLCRVYVGSISFEVGEDTIMSSFSPFGTVKKVSMSQDPSTNKHKGFAFVEYDLPEAAQLALDNMNGIQIGGRQIKVGRPSNLPQATPVIQQIHEECQQNNRIYISNIQQEWNEHELAELCEPFGKIISCKLAIDPKIHPQRHRGCGFIEFETEAAASEALGLNKLPLAGSVLHVCRATTPADMILPDGTLDQHGTINQQSGTSNSEDDIQMQLERTNKELSGDTATNQGGPVNHNSTNGISCNEARVSNVICLTNMITADEDLDDDLHLDVYGECSKHGEVTQVVIHIDKRPPASNLSDEPNMSNSADQVRIFVKYKDSLSSARALNALNGRFFAGRKVLAEHYDREMFRRHIYTDINVGN